MTTPERSREPALELRDLDVAYTVRGKPRQVIHGLSFEIPQGHSYGLVGESGCGKSTVALATVRYLPRNGQVQGGSVDWRCRRARAQRTGPA